MVVKYFVVKYFVVKYFVVKYFVVYSYITENCLCIGANNFTPAIREYCIAEYPAEYTTKIDEHWNGKTKYENHYAMLLDAPCMTTDKIYVVPPGKENGIFSHKWLGRLGYLKLKDLESLYAAKDMDFTQVPEFFFQVFTSLPHKPVDYDKYIHKYLEFQNKYLFAKHATQATASVIDLSNSDSDNNEPKNNDVNTTDKEQDAEDQMVVDEMKRWQKTPSGSPSTVVKSMFCVHLFLLLYYYYTVLCYIYQQM